jgi:hypothetical protein
VTRHYNEKTAASAHAAAQIVVGYPRMIAKQLHTRFLWPFSIGRDGYDHVEAALGSS